MIPEIKINPIYSNNRTMKTKASCSFSPATTPISISSFNLPRVGSSSAVYQPSTYLSPQDSQKYLYLLNFLRNAQKSPNSPAMLPNAQLDYLLKNGKLLSRTPHDNSSVLDNLYSIATTQRAYGLDQLNLITSTLDILCNPRYVTQTFGDIPDSVKQQAISRLPNDNPAKQDLETMDVFLSGTCAAASIETNMADKYPAEFARWVSKLSSCEKQLELNVDLKAISKNPIEAMQIVSLLKADKVQMDFKKLKVKVDLDDGAYVRAYTQTKHWDNGERNVADVLVQSAIMRLGSQGTYNSLNDTRAGEFNDNPQGLIELEKTYVESLIKNKEITSLVYHQIDDDQNLIGYNCSLDKISKHITDTIDSGDDVILGYVLTNETAGMTQQADYNPATDGQANKVINGHEITVVDYYRDEQGKIVFVCVDTDDDSPELVQYSEDWLLPKIHHAGYPAHIVAQDEREIMKNMI
ncbi:MAG: hypothetical protein IJB79_07455 [Candidatus Gastranaerophilales bacterium]|nr:hypothetical protein [Candidatus Gastranaerophilales bacterium]